ncbi:MAG: DUF3592 domain-containing protein [Phycisphaerae bacterium]|nr:DUF3592 domain-containing protein [Phycisphaerae bacterium]
MIRLLTAAFLFTFLSLGVTFTVIGVVLTNQQRFRLHTFRPTAAVVTASHIHYGSQGGTKSPIVHYIYHVDGKRYLGDRVLAVGGLSESGDWANKIVSQYPVGLQTRAWFNPAHPYSSFLIHQKSVMPALLFWIGVALDVMFVCGVLLVLRRALFWLLMARYADGLTPWQRPKQ